MKTIIMAVAILLGGTVTFAQDKTKSKHAHQHSAKAKTKYTCTMHPEVVRSRPGKCPKCGMTLTKMKMKKAMTDKSMEAMKM